VLCCTVKALFIKTVLYFALTFTLYFIRVCMYGYRVRYNKSDSPDFSKLLETHYFSLAFNVC